MKRLIPSLLLALSLVLALSVFAEALQKQPRGDVACKFQQTVIQNGNVDFTWKHQVIQSWVMWVMLPSVASVSVEQEETCIGESWAKQVAEAPKPVQPPPPPPPKESPPPKVEPPKVEPPKAEPKPTPPVEKPKPVPPPVVEKPKPKPVLDPVPFDINKTNINPIGAKVLDKNGVVMKEYPNMKVEIGGHTDATGSEIANKVISEKRANSCKQYLLDKFKISGDRMTIKGYSSSKPIGDNKTREGKEKNRRVEFIILSY